MNELNPPDLWVIGFISIMFIVAFLGFVAENGSIKNNIKVITGMILFLVLLIFIPYIVGLIIQSIFF